VSLAPCCDQRRGRDRWPSSGARCLPRPLDSDLSSSPGRTFTARTCLDLHLTLSAVRRRCSRYLLTSLALSPCDSRRLVCMSPCVLACSCSRPYGELTPLGAAQPSPACLLPAPRPPVYSKREASQSGSRCIISAPTQVTVTTARRPRDPSRVHQFGRGETIRNYGTNRECTGVSVLYWCIAPRRCDLR
jgi:hypothetical protein